MAVILTTALTANVVRPGSEGVWQITADVMIEMAVGAALGWALGRAGRWAMGRLELPAPGLYPAFTLGLACLAFGLPTLVHGSGFLAVYVAGVVVGSGTLPHRVSIRRVHDALGWLSQIALFLLLGLLVFPSRLARVWFMGAGARGSRELFDIVFFVIVVGAIVPGATVPWVSRKLRVESTAPPEPQALIEIDAPNSQTDMRAYHIDRALAVNGAQLSEIPFPPGAAVSVIERGGGLSAPNGSTRLQPGDHVYIVARTENRPELELLFGHPHEEH